jgi:hypothetical protein
VPRENGEKREGINGESICDNILILHVDLGNRRKDSGVDTASVISTLGMSIKARSSKVIQRKGVRCRHP